MKEFLKKSLILTILILFAAYYIPAIWNENVWENSFVLQIFGVSLLICFIQLLLNRWKTNWYLLELLAEYTMVVIVVMLTGLFFRWFPIKELWIVFVYVTPVYIVGYFLGLARVKKEIDEINEEIRARKAKRTVNQTVEEEVK